MAWFASMWIVLVFIRTCIVELMPVSVSVPLFMCARNIYTSFCVFFFVPILYTSIIEIESSKILKKNVLRSHKIFIHIYLCELPVVVNFHSNEFIHPNQPSTNKQPDARTFMMQIRKESERKKKTRDKSK